MVECPDPNLQQQMRTSFGPFHLLPVAEALARYLVDHRLHEARRDRLAVTPPLTIVRNEGAIPVNLRVEFLDRFQKLAYPTIAGVDRDRIEVHLDQLDLLQCLIYIAVPEEP
jgi:hypothetical protein